MRPITEELSQPLPDQLIVVDPSLRDYIGHHAQYDQTVLRAARQAAVDAAVLAHRESLRFVRIEGAVDPVFSQDIWSRRRVGARGYVLVRVAVHRLAQALTVVPFVLGPLVAAIRSAVPASLRVLVRRIARRHSGRPPESASSASGSAGQKDRVDPSADGVAPMAAAGWGAWRRRLLALILFPLRAVGRYGALRIQKTGIPLGVAALFMSNPRYFFEAIDAIGRRRTQGRTQVFFHMIVADNLLESVLLAIWSGRNLNAPAALLFRYPPALCLARRVRAKLAFRLLERAFEAGSIRLLTDSQRLAMEYSEYCFVPMEVVPIPHGAPCSFAPPVRRARLRVASLGNARAEKGILEIIDAIEILRSRPVFDQLEFVLQVNDPSQDCRDRIDQWSRSGQGHGVDLIHGALDSDAYSALFESVDLVLAPYWRDVYASRTSGILLEALASAKPVVVTADTWMSDELERWGSGLAVADRDALALADAIETIAGDFESYSALAQHGSRSSRQFHSAGPFFEHLVGRRRSRFLRDRRIFLSYPWANLFLRDSGASVRCTLLVDALMQSGHQVTVHCASGKEVAAAPPQIQCIQYCGTRSTVRAPLFFLATLIRVLGAPWQYEARDLWFRMEYWCRERPFRLLLNRALYDCIAVFLEYPFLADVVAPVARGHRIPLVVTAHDVLSKQVTNALARRQLMCKETAAMRCATLAVCVSEADVHAFKEQGCTAELAPNPVDADATQPMPGSSAREILDRYRLLLPDPFCLFVGSNHPPNREAARHMHGFSCTALQDLSQMSFVTLGACWIDEPASARFIQLGRVSSEVLAAAYSLAQFVLVPLTQGTGTSVKVIEAMAYGKVVIGTPSAFRGLPVSDGTNAIIASDPTRIPDRVAELIREPERMKAIAEHARSFALRFDYRVAFRPYLALLQGTAWKCPVDSGPRTEMTEVENPEHASKNESLA